MPVQEVLLDDLAHEWVKATSKYARGFYFKHLSDGEAGRPYAHLMAIPRDGDNNEGHFHDAAQFQIMLTGSMVFPHLGLDAPELHYTDTNTAYGPFVAGKATESSICAVLRNKSAGIVWNWERDKFRGELNLDGREILGRFSDQQWEESPRSLQGIRRKTLFGVDGLNEPKAHMYECEPGSVLKIPAAPHGEFQAMLKGSATFGDTEIRPFSMRYIVGDEPASDLTSGPEGATWVIMTFDEKGFD